MSNVVRRSSALNHRESSIIARRRSSYIIKHPADAVIRIRPLFSGGPLPGGCFSSSLLFLELTTNSSLPEAPLFLSNPAGEPGGSFGFWQPETSARFLPDARDRAFFNREDTTQSISP